MPKTQQGVQLPPEQSRAIDKFGDNSKDQPKMFTCSSGVTLCMHQVTHWDHLGPDVDSLAIASLARGIWAAKHMIASNTAWRVSLLSDKNLWTISDINPRKMRKILVKDLLDAEGLNWNGNLLQAFSPTAASRLLSVALRDLKHEDSLIWTLTAQGRDIVKWIIEVSFLSHLDAQHNQAFHQKNLLPFDIMAKYVLGEFSFLSKGNSNRSLAKNKTIVNDLSRSDVAGSFKVLVDVAFSNNTAEAGVIVRDSTNQLQAFYACKVAASSVIQGELLAVMKGIEVVKFLGLDRGRILSDRQVLTKAVESSKAPNWSTASSFAKLLQAIEGTKFFLQWTPRTANVGAHALAKWGLCNDCSGFVNFWELYMLFLGCFVRTEVYFGPQTQTLVVVPPREQDTHLGTRCHLGATSHALLKTELKSKELGFQSPPKRPTNICGSCLAF
ncbi:hypothetical protein G4B88_023260 [Cannabis sativa]|uniref:RNase H type-1 domain-containing protein n=1 Tax=Cannabis sativa TaxID=3483 RepID=A0A7J6HYT8_CANSA|nr:hypothetical protein G4B88_023260 [Cannabis sativa]